jgi:hydrogenase maturation protein HypF
LIATARAFERTACLRPLALPGGEAAIRQPWRIAAAMLCELRMWDASVAHRLPDQAIVDAIASNRRFSPLSTSIGRLFDAVAALVLPDFEIRLGSIGYEGHFAAMLEDLCNLDAQGTYPFPALPGEPVVQSPGGQPATPPRLWLDWRPLLRAIVRDIDSGVARADIAMRFHRSLAAAIGQIARRHPGLPIVLGGGVFQNKILTELVRSELAGRTIAFPGEIPVSDGGLAAGQLAIACAQLEQERCA